ncbi:PH domain-containing protein [Luteimonas sp. BDR2-5]|uniref:PH domain-containing protein n=1 Tax=Proluteimonas luteida TaxID=2878685 RepID=UPI001E609918|nr:PH domain-containing protein [Luteimonas sp. BDR2-5]MCD9027360.1 PH domain-containing protein [Luteimonas sp. BDR2-5]
MTTPAEPAPATPPLPLDSEHRLHPWSWLFVLLQNLRQFIVPLAVLVFAGRGRGDGLPVWLPLIGVAALVLVSVWQYLTYRYRIADDRLIVRSGLLERSVRQIPYSRIHNVAIHQSLLHRLLGVAEVRLESAGGHRPEAQMRVLTMPQALALERLIRNRGQAAADDAQTAAPAGRTLLALSTAEVVKLGLISNRGMIVVAGAFALAWQVLPDRAMGDWLLRGGRQAADYANTFGTTWLAKAASVALVLAVALALIRAFSVLLALVRYHGFRLQRQGRRLTVERGLLSRSRSSVPRRRIQAWTLREGLLHRLFARRTLEIDTAAARGGNGQSGGGDAGHRLDALAPIAPPATCDAIVRDVATLPTWPPADWQPLHPRAWLRLLLGDVVVTALLCAALGWFFHWWGLLGLLWLPWSAFVARRHASRAGYAIDDTLVAVREGWWTRHWRFAEVDKLQTVELRQSPLDRGFGMAAVWFDTAGANPLAPQLRLRYLPLATAERIHATLAKEIARRPLRW